LKIVTYIQQPNSASFNKLKITLIIIENKMEN